MTDDIWECDLCGHLTNSEAEMAVHLGDDHSSWDLAEYATEALSTKTEGGERSV